MNKRTESERKREKKVTFWPFPFATVVAAILLASPAPGHQYGPHKAGPSFGTISNGKLYSDFLGVPADEYLACFELADRVPMAQQLFRTSLAEKKPLARELAFAFGAGHGDFPLRWKIIEDRLSLLCVQPFGPFENLRGKRSRKFLGESLDLTAARKSPLIRQCGILSLLYGNNVKNQLCDKLKDHEPPLLYWA